jgi:hypothetical protein
MGFEDLGATLSNKRQIAPFSNKIKKPNSNPNHASAALLIK